MIVAWIATTKDTKSTKGSAYKLRALRDLRGFQILADETGVRPDPLGQPAGNDAAPGLIRSTIKGPDYLTSGKFGVESSVLALLMCTSTGIVMLVMTHRRGLVVPPIWKRTG